MALKSYLDIGGADGSGIGKATTSKIFFFDATPVTQQTAGTSVTAENLGGSPDSAYVASMESLVVATASLANANATTLTNLGLQA